MAAGIAEWSQWVGAALMAAAVELLRRSHADLGCNGSPKLETGSGQRLVTGGIYRRIRHPMYASTWLWGIAQALLLHNRSAGCSNLISFLPFTSAACPGRNR